METCIVKAGSASQHQRDSMVRVDQAGEYGATRIYAGQLAILRRRSQYSGAIAHMAEQEEVHRAAFDKMLIERAVRPTLLQPLWDKAGFALGAASAMLGEKAAMACTVAVETEIDAHYSEQLNQLGNSDEQLSEMVTKFRAEELEHKDTALEAKAEEAPAYPLLVGVIRLGCRAAIALSKRL